MVCPRRDDARPLDALVIPGSRILMLERPFVLLPTLYRREKAFDPIARCVCLAPAPQLANDTVDADKRNYEGVAQPDLVQGHVSRRVMWHLLIRHLVFACVEALSARAYQPLISSRLPLR